MGKQYRGKKREKKSEYLISESRNKKPKLKGIISDFVLFL